MSLFLVQNLVSPGTNLIQGVPSFLSLERLVEDRNYLFLQSLGEGRVHSPPRGVLAGGGGGGGRRGTQACSEFCFWFISPGSFRFFCVIMAAGQAFRGGQCEPPARAVALSPGLRFWRLRCGQRVGVAGAAGHHRLSTPSLLSSPSFPGARPQRCISLQVPLVTSFEVEKPVVPLPCFLIFIMLSHSASRLLISKQTQVCVLPFVTRFCL